MFYSFEIVQKMNATIHGNTKPHIKIKSKFHVPTVFHMFYFGRCLFAYCRLEVFYLYCAM